MSSQDPGLESSCGLLQLPDKKVGHFAHFALMPSGSTSGAQLLINALNAAIGTLTSSAFVAASTSMTWRFLVARLRDEAAEPSRAKRRAADIWTILWNALFVVRRCLWGVARVTQ